MVYPGGRGRRNQLPVGPSTTTLRVPALPCRHLDVEASYWSRTPEHTAVHPWGDCGSSSSGVYRLYPGIAGHPLPRTDASCDKRSPRRDRGSTPDFPCSVKLGYRSQYKDTIIKHKYRVGQKKKPIPHFEIPKLELLQSIVSCIQWSGSLPQWSADSTEHSHTQFVKKPKSKANGIKYYSQICRHLDHEEKIRMFDLASAAHESTSTDPLYDADSDIEDLASDTGEGITGHPAAKRDRRRGTSDFFSANATGPPPNPLTSSTPRTFATSTTGFQLRLRPHITRAEIDVVAMDFRIPNLHVSIRDFLSHYLYDQETRRIAGRQGTIGSALLPFDEIRVWYAFRAQNYDSNGSLRPPQRLFASPPSSDWPSGRCDTALFRESVDVGSPQRPGPGLKGWCFAR
jgi:hypothetical protein